MKLTERTGRLAGVILAISMAVTSCYDDSALVERVTQLEYNLEALQQSLTEQLNALNALMKESIYIKTCDAKDDGSYELTLSSGDKFTVYPDQSLESVVTYISMSGTKYWAYYDEKGEAQLIYDAAGSRIPITTVPKVVLEDGVNYLVFGSERFPLSGNSVFSAYEINKDEQGNVISATFTFGKDMSFTIPMGDGKGVRFVYQNIDQTIVLTEQYVSYGETVDVQVELVGVLDYVWKEPKGWTIEEYEDDYGYTYLSITAPSKAQIEAGNAVEGGILKVVSVLEGNGAGVSRLELTANPFNKMTVSAGVAAVDICFGLQKYAYGICAKADFDESVIVAKATEMLASSSSSSAGYEMAERAVEFPVASVYGSEMIPGENYVFWALPAVYNEEDGFLFVEGTIQVKEFVHTTLKFELDEENVTFRDAALSFDLKGAAEYYGGIFKKPELDETSTLFGNILPYIEGGEIRPLTAPMLYEGSAFKFAGANVVSEPNTTYVVWLLVPELGQTKFSEADVKYIEFTTSPLSSGSSVTVDAEVTPGYVNAKASVSAEGAELIFYSFMKSTSASAYATDEQREKYLLTQGDYVKASAAEVATAADAKFDPGTKLTLFTLAVDQNGAYGPVTVKEFALRKIEYNSDLAVTLEVKTNEPNNLVVNISSKSEGVEYIYWVGKTSESFWTGSSNLGGTEAKASKFMFLNPDNSRFSQMASNYPVTDGKIVFDDLSLKTDYILVVMARKMIGSEMSCSPAKTLRFTTKAMALGTIVTEAGNPTAWNAAKPTITWIPERFTAPAGMMNATMAFNFERPQGVNLTYYVMSATDSYFNDGKESMEISMEDLIISIVEQSGKAEDANTVIQNHENWIYPNDYKFTHYHHGFSMRGHCLIFPDKAAHDAICNCGGCVTGVITVNQVENLPWEQKVYYYSDCPLEFMSDAVGAEGIDKIFVTCRDSEGNFYEPFVIPVPYEHFANAGSRDE